MNSSSNAFGDEGLSIDANVDAIDFKTLATSSSDSLPDSKLSSMGVPSKNSWPIKCLSPSSTKNTGLQVYCGRAALKAFERSYVFSIPPRMKGEGQEIHPNGV